MVIDIQNKLQRFRKLENMVKERDLIYQDKAVKAYKGRVEWYKLDLHEGKGLLDDLRTHPATLPIWEDKGSMVIAKRKG